MEELYWIIWDSTSIRKLFTALVLSDSKQIHLDLFVNLFFSVYEWQHIRATFVRTIWLPYCDHNVLFYIYY